MADGSLIFDTRIDSNGFNRGADNLGGSLKGILKTMSKLGAAVGAAFGVKKVIDFGKKAVGAASDLAEVQNVVDTAFGEMSYKMEEFADSAIEMYGISKTTAKQTASTYMAMAKALGLSPEAASDMSLALTGLTADMASFYNVEQSVADTAIKSVFTGETESLKQFGIVMTDANLQAFALSNGITKSTSSMTQAEKVQLRYAYVMEQTALAQGDFAKTSGGWANQTRILSEKWNEFSTVVGSGIMQIALPALQALNSVMDRLIAGATKAYNSLAQVFGWEIQNADASGEIAINTALSAANQADLTERTEETSNAAKNAVMGFDEINKLSENNTESADNGGAFDLIGSVPANVTTIKTDVETVGSVNKIEEFAEKIKHIFGKVKAWYDDNFKGIFDGLTSGWKKELNGSISLFKRVFTSIKSYCEPLVNWFKNNFTPMLQSTVKTVGNLMTRIWHTVNKVLNDVWTVADKIIGNFIGTVLPFLTDLKSQIMQTLDPLFEWIDEIFNDLWNDAVYPILTQIGEMWTDLMTIISNVWAEHGEAIFEKLRTAIEKAKATFSEFYNNVIQPIFQNIIEWIKKMWDEHLQPFAAKIAEFIAKLIEGALTIYNQVILPIVGYLSQTLGPTIKNVFGVVLDILETVIGVVIDLVGTALDYFGGLIDFLTGVFTGDWEKMWSGLQTMAKASWQQILTIIIGAANLIIDGLNLLWTALYTQIANVVNGVGSIAETIGDLLGKDWGWEMPKEVPRIPHIPIPALAQGTVVPASHGEFLAKLGDNNRETEIVSPLSTMKQALAEALAENNFGSDGGDISITIMLDGAAIYKDIVKRNKQNTRKSGVNALA